MCSFMSSNGAKKTERALSFLHLTKPALRFCPGSKDHIIVPMSPRVENPLNTSFDAAQQVKLTEMTKFYDNKKR